MDNNLRIFLFVGDRKKLHERKTLHRIVLLCQKGIINGDNCPFLSVLIMCFYKPELEKILKK